MSLEKVVALKQSDRTFLLLWAGLAHLDGSLHCTFGSWPKEGVQIGSRLGWGDEARPSSAPGLMKIRDVSLLTSVQAGFAPEVCRLTVLFPMRPSLVAFSGTFMNLSVFNL